MRRAGPSSAATRSPRPGRQARPVKRSTHLTAQERQISRYIADGLTNREIADRMLLSPRTVEYHLGRIYRKLGLRSRQDLVRHVTSGALM